MDAVGNWFCNFIEYNQLSGDSVWRSYRYHDAGREIAVDKLKGAGYSG